jgi:hypothetical protein
LAILVTAVEDVVGAGAVRIKEREYLLVTEHAWCALHPADFAAGVHGE